jgi:hypothetical protein
MNKKTFFFQNREQEGKNSSCLGGWLQWEGGGIRKGCRKVKMVETLRTHVCKWKTETC